LNRIEEGTYGVVYRARDKKTGQYLKIHNGWWVDSKLSTRENTVERGSISKSWQFFLSPN